MMRRVNSLLRRFVNEDAGQVIPMVALMMVCLLAMTGFAVDVGRALFVYRELQASTDAAAMAGAKMLPDQPTAVAAATKYSGVSGNLNARGSMSGVTMVSGYPKVACLATLSSEGMACGSTVGNGNAIQVRQQIKIPMVFLTVIGKTSLTMGAVATASMQGGGGRGPYNVAVIVDTTGSMGGKDSDSTCNATRLSCALAGVQVLLQNLSPCPPTLTTCGTAVSGNYPNAVDRVALYTFPAFASSTEVAHEYDCTTTVPKATTYPESGFGGTQGIYQVVGYSSDYKTSTGATTLNPQSNLVKAVGGVSGCGMKAMSGVNTYIAGVMYAAGSDLIAMQNSSDPTVSGRQSIVVILTDGDMNTPSTQLLNASKTSGTYASSINECAQAVSLAQYASQYKITVYSVAYGASSSGCSTDQTSITPCTTVQQLASADINFYSDYTASGGSSSCISAAHPTTGLKDIFSQIAGTLTPSRLIPDNMT